MPTTLHQYAAGGRNKNETADDVSSNLAGSVGASLAGTLPAGNEAAVTAAALAAAAAAAHGQGQGQVSVGAIGGGSGAPYMLYQHPFLAGWREAGRGGTDGGGGSGGVHQAVAGQDVRAYPQQQQHPELTAYAHPSGHLPLHALSRAVAPGVGMYQGVGMWGSRLGGIAPQPAGPRWAVDGGAEAGVKGKAPTGSDADVLVGPAPPPAPAEKGAGHDWPSSGSPARCEERGHGGGGGREEGEQEGPHGDEVNADHQDKPPVPGSSSRG